MILHQARRALLETAKKMSAAGLSRGTSGNVSVRVDGGLLITPTGMSYDLMGPDDLVLLRERTYASQGQRAPSSEWRLHRDLYARRPEVEAILHAHPTYCTTFASLHQPILAVHYMIAVTGAAQVRCAPYATFGTEALSEATVQTLGQGKACLMANHGMVAVGADLGEAFKIASEVEWVAEQYWRALQIGKPVIIDDAEMARVIEKFKTYGQPVRRLRGA